MIPKKFNIGPYTYSVNFEDEVFIEGDEQSVYGTHLQDTEQITIGKKMNNIILSDKIKLQVFYHELVHAILKAMGEYELNGSERFVEGFSTFLTQYELTKK